MNYIDEYAARIAALCYGSWDACSPEDRRLLRLYAVIGFVLDGKVGSYDVHDAWAAWRIETLAAHPSIVPFNELSPEIADLDNKYRDAIIAAWKANSE